MYQRVRLYTCTQFGAQVSTNGYITFSEPTTTCCPVRFDFFSTPVFIVAPYWADSDIRQGGTVIYDVYDDRGPELELLNHVINDRFGIDFEGQWGLTAQWFQVPQFGREEPEVVSLCLYLCSLAARRICKTIQ